MLPYLATLKLLCMNHKKILIAVTPDCAEGSIFDFLERNLDVRQLYITICQVCPDQLCDGIAPRLDQFLDFCSQRDVSCDIKLIDRDSTIRIQSEMAFADVMIIQKAGLKTLQDDYKIGSLSCPAILLPSPFGKVSNVVLALDGTRRSLYAIKQFFQIFSNKMEDLHMTLFDINRFDKSELTIEEESMLIAYLKLYNSNLAVHKVKYPVSEVSMIPLGINHETLVVGSVEFLLSQKEVSSAFKPFYDSRTAVFMPAHYE